MSDSKSAQLDVYIDVAIQIVAAYVSNNSIPKSEMPALIQETYAAVAGLSNGLVSTLAEAEAGQQASPAQIRKSITPDALISFVDGKPYKTLKRHLATHGLDAAGYRARYGLPDNYPLVAPSYAKMRSELARRNGLGRSGSNG